MVYGTRQLDNVPGARDAWCVVGLHCDLLDTRSGRMYSK
jgi:hypothetical protein